eukprot:UN01361
MVQVKSLDGRQFQVEATTVAQLKAQLSALVGMEVDQQVIMAQGQVMANDAAINVTEVFVVADVDGGAKKKKKVYSKPKKNKHKNKKIKLRILNLYKIEGNGTVVRLRKECSSCGAGSFMANHPNRLYCGNCHKTLARDF